MSRNCQQCNHPVDPEAGSMVVLPKALWNSIAKDDEFLCIPCMEGRLGRPLAEADFPETVEQIYHNVEAIPQDIACNMIYFWKVGMFNMTKEKLVNSLVQQGYIRVATEVILS